MLTYFYFLLGLLDEGFASGIKYGPKVVPLSRDTHHEYFATRPASDFWSAIGYYQSQGRDGKCSAAAFSTVLNALRRDRALLASEKLVTVDSFIQDFGNSTYKNLLNFNKLSLLNPKTYEGVANKNLLWVIDNAFEKLGLKGPGAKVELVRTEKDSKLNQKKFREALVENEKSAEDFIVIVFMQDQLTGDPEGDSHLAVLGAYDEKTRSVLILDPDRNFYEPYWSPEAAVLEAMSDPKADSRGETGWFYLRRGQK